MGIVGILITALIGAFQGFGAAILGKRSHTNMMIVNNEITKEVNRIGKNVTVKLQNMKQ